MDIDKSYYLLEYSKSITKAGHIREWDPYLNNNRLIIRLKTAGSVVESHLLLSVLRVRQGRKGERTILVEEVKLNRLRTNNGDIDLVADGEECMIGVSYPSQVNRKMFEIRLMKHDYDQILTFFKMAGIKIIDVRSELCINTPEQTQQSGYNQSQTTIISDTELENTSNDPTSLNNTISGLFTNSQVTFDSQELNSQSNSIIDNQDSNSILREKIINLLGNEEFISLTSRIEIIWKDLTRW